MRWEVLMETNAYKEVYFDRYCSTCKYQGLLGTDDPCDECLAEPVNLYSHKPVKYEEASK